MNWSSFASVTAFCGLTFGSAITGRNYHGESDLEKLALLGRDEDGVMEPRWRGFSCVLTRQRSGFPALALPRPTIAARTGRPANSIRGSSRGR